MNQVPSSSTWREAVRKQAHTSAELTLGEGTQLRPFSIEVCLTAFMPPWFGKGKICMENTSERGTKGDKEGTERERGRESQRGRRENTRRGWHLQKQAWAAFCISSGINLPRIFPFKRGRDFQWEDWPYCLGGSDSWEHPSRPRSSSVVDMG